MFIFIVKAREYFIKENFILRHFYFFNNNKVYLVEESLKDDKNLMKQVQAKKLQKLL